MHSVFDQPGERQRERECFTVKGEKEDSNPFSNKSSCVCVSKCVSLESSPLVI